MISAMAYVVRSLGIIPAYPTQRAVFRPAQAQWGGPLQGCTSCNLGDGTFDSWGWRNRQSIGLGVFAVGGLGILALAKIFLR